MALYQLGDVFGYQDANNIKKLWAASTPPADPGEGEVWLDISLTPCRLKRYNGVDWEIIGQYTADQILDLLKTVDGTGSGLDADKLDGQHGADFHNAALLTGSVARARLSELSNYSSPQPGQAGTKKDLACPRNYKIQITNYKQRGVLRTNFKRLRREAQSGIVNFEKLGEIFWSANDLY